MILRTRATGLLRHLPVRRFAASTDLRARWQHTFSTSPRSVSIPRIHQNRPRISPCLLFSQHQRTYANPTTTTSPSLDHLTDLYATARDEFEIAAEETEKKTIYAADDRAACAEALAELKAEYDKAVREAGGPGSEVGKVIQGRVGQRIRELENAVKGMELSALED